MLPVSWKQLMRQHLVDLLGSGEFGKRKYA
jgi:hypothetical protein